jgi:hypothetical protein
MEDHRRTPLQPDTTLAQLWLAVYPVLERQIEIGDRAAALKTLGRLRDLAEEVVRTWNRSLG